MAKRQQKQDQTQDTQDQEVILENDPLSFLHSFVGPDDSEMWADRYPIIQWNNPEKKWELPIKYWGGTRLEQEHEAVEVEHDNGQSIELSILAEELNIAVIAWRYSWEKRTDDGRKIYTAQFPEGEEGWNKRYHFLCLLKEAGTDEPALITVRGHTGEFLYNAIYQFRRRITKLAARASGDNRTFPGYMFWIPLVGGEKRMVGGDKKSAIYPPVAVVNDISELDDEGVATLLQSLYIGDELMAIITGDLFNEGQAWVDEHKQRLLTGSNGSTPGQQSVKAEILPGNVLVLPDLSDGEPRDWIACAMSTGLFDEESTASSAFARVLRRRPGLIKKPGSEQWAAFQAELEKRWQEKVEREEAIERERMLQAG